MTLVATLVEFKDWIKYTTVGTENDAKLTMCLTSASSWAEWRTDSRLAPTEFTERLRINGCTIKQKHHPLISATSVTPEFGSALPSTSYVVDTTNSLIELRFPYYGWATLVYMAGMASIASHVKEAGLEVARHLWQVQNGATGRGYMPEDTMVTPMGFSIPNRAEELISVDPDNALMPGFA